MKKPSHSGVIGCALLLVGLASFSGCRSRSSSDAYETPKGSNPPGSAARDTTVSGRPAGHDHAAAQDTTALPATLPEIWNEVKAHRQELDQAIAAGNFGAVHPLAIRISRLVTAMGPLSGQYVSTRQGPLTDGIRRVGQIADLMHDAADRGDAEGTRNQKERLDSVLDFIHSLYPADVLGTS